MTRLALDAMGGDHAPAEIVAGAVEAALFIVRRIAGIDRPCLGAVFPARSGPVLIVDVGATPDARPVFLVQWAQMAALYAERALGRRAPTVGLLSNGEEEVKGNEL